MLIFDHLKLVKRDSVELARFRTHLLSLQTGNVEEVSVQHEHDESCCRREPWSKTLSDIVQAVKPTVEIVNVSIGEPPQS